MKAADDYIKKNAVIIHAEAVAEAYRTINKNEFAEFLGFVSNTYDDMTLYELAIKYNMYSLKILEESNQNNTTLYASICNNLASIYFDLDRYNDSLNYYNLAINIYEHTEIYHAADIATSYNGIARTYRNIKDYKNAISFHKKVLIILFYYCNVLI